jgi:hypothetical protein
VAVFFWNLRISISGKGTSLSRIARILLVVLIAGVSLVSAQAPPSSDAAAFDPVAHVRNARSWEYGPFLNYGTGVGDRSDFKFLWAGFQAGKPLSPVVHAGIISGQFELSGNVMPLWQAYTPAASQRTYTYPIPGGGTGTSVGPFGGGTYRGVSITPVILRWNFLTNSRRLQPWFQGAGGLIYTTHKFPPALLVPHGVAGGTSVWNFTPQGGGGIHYFIRPKRSIDLGVNAVHISSASLGDKNPGVNASIQIQVGYTYWK